MAERNHKSSKDKAASSQAGPDDSESKRLRDRAVGRGSLARSKANSSEVLQPSKAILKCNGKDIVKRGHRKNKYLFSFPGLLAPVTGGVLGELAQLDTKNPVMYIALPEGRMKLFGTLVYPKNKYLTLHFSKGAGNITCEDCFENMVVFSECWWIGSKEENSSEARLAIPESILKRQTHDRFDFTGGAGRRPEAGSNDATTSKPGEAQPKERQEEGTPEPEASDSGPETVRETGAAEPEPSSSRRKSSRTAGKTFKFAEPRSDDDLEKDGSDSDSDSDDAPLRQPAARPGVSVQAPKRSRPSDTSAKETPKRRPVTIDLDSDEEDEKLVEPSQVPPRSKRKAASTARAPGSRKTKKARKNEEDDTGDDSSEDLSDLSESGSDSDEEWKL